MKKLVGQVTQKYPNGALIVWFKNENFGSKYFCTGDETNNIVAGDLVTCEFDDQDKLGAINSLIKN